MYDIPINIGDKLYTLAEEKQYFKQDCPLAAFGCSLCGDNSCETFCVTHYTLKSYMVHKITIEAYPYFDSNNKRVVVSMYSKENAQLNEPCSVVDLDINDLLGTMRSVFYKDYRMALNKAELLNAEEYKKFAEFNYKSGTAHTLSPWKRLNDR